MSQSDYLSKKKIILQLQKQTELLPILNSSFYTLSKSHSIARDVSNSLITPNQLIIQPNVTNDCSNFLMCSSTNMRPNRVLNTTSTCSVVRHYVKNKKNHGCNKFCYDSSHNLLHTNNTNRLFSAYNNKRMKDLCICKAIV